MRNNRALAALSLLPSLLLLLPHGAAAQQRPEPDTVRLAPVVVTATRLPTPLAQAPGSITVITGEELRQRGIRMVADAMRLVPGTTVVQSAGPGGLTSVFIRGGESDYVQVLVDGVQANDPGGAFNWAHLRADDIDRIEIVRGPASVLYGSDAVTGVVQIFTRAGGAPRVEASAATHRGSRFESDAAFATHAFDASVAGATSLDAVAGGRLNYGFNAGRLSSTGLYAFNSDYTNIGVSGRLQLAAQRGDAAVSVRHNDNRFHYPTTGSGRVVDPNQFATGRTWSVGADGGYHFSSAVELRLNATSYTFDSRTEDPADHEDDGSFWHTGEQARRKLDARLNWSAGSFVLTGGVERQWQHGMTALESVSQWGVYTDETDDERTNTGVYAQLHGAPLPAVAVTLGARLDENSAFGAFRTGRAAASWAPIDGARLHVAAGTAFKEPTFFENYAVGFTRGNPDLEPEQSVSREAGAQYALLQGRLTFGATWFDQRFSNLIQYTATPAAGAPNYSNVGDATARGLEVELTGTPAPHLSLQAQYTLTRTRVTDAGYGSDMAFRQDKRLLRRPEHQASAGAAFRVADAVRARADLRYVGERDDLDFTDPAEWNGIPTALAAYTTVDSGVEIDLLRRRPAGLTASLRVRNLFDADYVEIYNFPRPGRVFELGVRTALPMR
jgi:vitamin B12 transporter